MKKIALSDKFQFSKVEPYFFKNEDIQYIYSIVRNEYIVSKNKVVATPQQILAMVKLSDTEKNIADNLVKMLLKGDNTAYEDEWISEKFKAWKISNLTKNNVLKSIELIRGLEEINYDNVVDIASKIQQIHNEVSLIADDDEDLGDDFDDPESHKQRLLKNTIPSGWSAIDSILGGGWSKSTFNVLMGETNVGKCLDYQSIIKIKNKKTGEIKEIAIGDLYKKLN